MPTVDCPECTNPLDVKPNPSLGEIVDCDDCGVDLEVVGIDPLELDVVEDEEDLFDDDEDDDEY